MRLLNAEALIYDNIAELEYFSDERSIPPYAILSHTWAEEEVLFEDIALGPQHEIQPSAASIRAFHRRDAGQSVDFDSDMSFSDDESVRAKDSDGALFDVNLSDDFLEDEEAFDELCEETGDFDKQSSTSASSDGSLADSFQWVGGEDLRCDKCSAYITLHSMRMKQLRPHVKAGWNKVLNTCLQTLREGLQYVWIDTCCIDKASSAELSEAINSMFRWYHNSTICYAYLGDCVLCPGLDPRSTAEEIESLQAKLSAINRDPKAYLHQHHPELYPGKHKIPSTRRSRSVAAHAAILAHSTMATSVVSGTSLPSKLMKKIKDIKDTLTTRLANAKQLPLNHCVRSQLQWYCRWKTRGWTLQELISPRELHFFDKRWSFIARRSHIVSYLESITGIHRPALESQELGFSVAQRMYWASKRETTRIEDQAYCLLGIFGINMPLLYGEGVRAFQRLQEEIIKTSTDQSIFAWELRPDGQDELSTGYGLFAPSAANFRWHARDISVYHVGQQPRKEFHLTNEGMEIELPMDHWCQKHGCEISIAYLNCCIQNEDGSIRCGIGLRVLNTRSGTATLRVTLTERMYTQATVQQDAKIGGGSPRLQRLIEIPSAYEAADCITERMLIYRDKTLFNNNIGSPKSLDASSQMEVQIYFSKENDKTSRWRVRAAYPRNQWDASTSTMTLPLQQPVFGAIAVTRRAGDTCVVVLGSLSTRNLSSSTGSRGGNSLQCWILPHTTSNTTLANVSELYLRKLCDCASTFASKDYFESSTSRRDCHKCVRLPNGDVLRGALGGDFRSYRKESTIYQTLTLYVKDDDHEKTGPFAERNYFQLAQKYRLRGDDDRPLTENLASATLEIGA